MTSKRTLNRRQFIGTSSMGILGTGMLGLNRPRSGKAESPRIGEFRTLGRTGFKASDIAAGTFNQNPAILHALLEAGVNYIDTSEYYGGGREERIIGEVIKKHDRKSLFITDKLLLSRNRSKEGILARTRGCLERLQTDYIDCMMIAAVDDLKTLKAPGFHDAMAQLKSEGRVRFVGISNHGTQRAGTPKESRDEVLFQAVDDGRFDVLLLIYNFIARDLGEKVLEACAEKKIGATAMKTNPVNHYSWAIGEKELEEKEGRTFKERMDRFLERRNLRTPGEIRDAAIRFVLANRDVHSVCVSFFNFDAVEGYLNLSGSRLSESDNDKLAAYKKVHSRLYCRHACGICEPHCPHRVPVNTIMRFNHYFEAQGREKRAMVEYANLDTPKADLCQICEGHCEKACPYDVPIRGLLALAHERLSVV